ncbi:hypothetical protein ACFQ3J_26925 [Paenibacillus provencensis]|uniref:Restriction endonuclease n=1 Tax=Paenibacillus provencensis TaxID=441151 RepID=A0ABW3Q1W1_9BACL|nr:hypothetical protein [Paenibacillus sp. MER 78]MCM3130082.1 hypothetical protein [Paenibacillus sp. MER 78]
MKISELYQLHASQYELDFVDINVDLDLPLFLDSYFIRHFDTPFGRESKSDINSFISYFFNLLKSDLPDDARYLFSFLGEPNETCLGLSVGRPKGRGVGPEDTEKIFKAIIESTAFQEGVLEHLEDIRVFVPGIDKDKVSDMTTNLIRGQLIKYTQNQCRLWGIPLQGNVPSGFVWNRNKLEWEEFHTDMLVVNGKKILLVPKSIVTYSKEYSSQQYSQHFVLHFLQREHLSANSRLVRIRRKTKERYVTKKSVKEDLGTIDKEFLVKFTVKHPEVFKEFKKQSTHSLHSLFNEEINSEQALSDIISYLKAKLPGIPPGATHATEYHRTVMGILELLFYPSITSPSIEEEIHDGRKRIDIVFENSAEKGFFFRLPTVHQVPSSLIMVECKNYSRDVANPELDQMAGRFGPNRGKFGLILCRTIDNMETFLARCNDTCKDDRGYIIPIVDADLMDLLGGFLVSREAAVESFLNERFKKIIIN